MADQPRLWPSFSLSDSVSSLQLLLQLAETATLPVQGGGGGEAGGARDGKT